MNKENYLSLNILAPFINAWNLFFEILLPTSNLKPSNSSIFYAIPFIGLILGVIASIFSWFICTIGGSILAAVLCPFVIILFWELLNHAKDTSYLVHYIYQKIFSHYDHKNLEINNNENHFMIFYIFTAVFILRILCLGILIYFNNLGWIVVVSVLAYAVQAHLAGDESETNGIIKIEKNSIIIMWIVTIILCLIFGINHLPITILSIIIAVLIAINTKNNYLKSKTLSGSTIGFTGKYVEIIILLLGLLFRFHF